MSNPAVCIASCRKEHFADWLSAWREEFQANSVQVFAMCDAQHQDTIMPPELPDWVHSWDHQDVKNLLQDKAWIIPTQTGACKSFAILNAYLAGCDPILVLDDDCLPIAKNNSGWVAGHVIKLNGFVSPYVYNTSPGIRPRGTPYLPNVRVVLNHGLWEENPDIDAITSLSPPPHAYIRYQIDAPVPFGSLFPMCGMNIAFSREIAPLMYFGLQGPSWGVDRFDDIWCGFLVKKALDYVGLACTSGSPVIRHVRASDPLKSIVKEAPGYAMNIKFYTWVMNHQIGTGINRFLAPWDRKDEAPQPQTARAVLEAMATDMYQWANGGEYFRNYGKAILAWLDLFSR